MACRQTKKAGPAIKPIYCTCVAQQRMVSSSETVRELTTCEVHKGRFPDCNHVGCIDCRSNICCDDKTRIGRGPNMPQHVDRTAMRGGLPTS